MADMIQLRRDTAANWTSANPTLAQGEPGQEVDTGKLKIGDGSTAWSSLSYWTFGDNSIATDFTIYGSITEEVYELTGTDIDPANGTMQYKTITADTTFTESLADAQSVLLRLAGAGSYTITFPTLTWVTVVGNSAPTLTSLDVIALWKEGTTLYAAYVGSGATV